MAYFIELLGKLTFRFSFQGYFSIRGESRLLSNCHVQRRPLVNRNSSVCKALFTFRNLILDVKSTFLMHSNSLNVSPVSLCDSFDALTAFVLFKQSIGEGKRGNEFAEWYVAWFEEGHSYAECNISRMT